MTLPLYRDLPTPLDITKWDKLAMQDLPPVMLMENASREACHVLKRYKTLEKNMPVLIFMGGGNNGGDGAAIGRLLHEEGCNVVICHTVSLSSLQGAAKEHTSMAEKCGIPFYFLTISEDGRQKNASECLKTIEELLPKSHSTPSLIIDALTGTGLKGNLRQNVRVCVEAINMWKKHAFIFSIDIPSGLDGLEGTPLPIAVKADVTVTFEAAKPGIYLPRAKKFVGNLHIARIGIPKRIKKVFPPSWYLLDPQKGEWAKPQAELHKGTAGKVAVIGGSTGMIGAPFLSAQAALRAGAGLVRVFSPFKENPYLIPEIMSLSIGTKGIWEVSAVHEVIAAVKSMQPNAIVLGPGMGRNPEVASILNAVLKLKRNYPIILDADALYFFNEIKDSLQSQDILTPHPQEMVFLMPKVFFENLSDKLNYQQEILNQKNLQKNFEQKENTPTSIQTNWIQKNRGAAIRAVTKTLPCTVILKGAGTLIGQQNMPITLCPKDIPALAVGGSGDVLSGIIATVACSKISSYDAASLGVYLHAKSGEILQRKAPKGHLASDIANTIPFAWQELLPMKFHEK